MITGVGCGTCFCIPGNGAAAFVFGNSVLFDGVNDFLPVGSDSSTCFNPLNDSDWSVSFWAKSSASRFKHNGTVISVGQATSQNPRMYIRFLNDGGSNSKFTIQSNLQTVTSTHSITSAECQSWQHYVITCEQKATQEIKIYIDGTLVDTLNPATSTIADSSVSLQIGSSKGSTASNTFQGYLSEIALIDYAVSDVEVGYLYNGGSGSDPMSVLTSIVHYYKLTESVGTTTGSLADLNGNDSIVMTNFVSPQGIVADTP